MNNVLFLILLIYYISLNLIRLNMTKVQYGMFFIDNLS